MDYKGLLPAIQFHNTYWILHDNYRLYLQYHMKSSSSYYTFFTYFGFTSTFTYSFFYSFSSSSLSLFCLGFDSAAFFFLSSAYCLALTKTAPPNRSSLAVSLAFSTTFDDTSDYYSALAFFFCFSFNAFF